MIQFIYTLPFLICPIGMGLMMLMMRGKGQDASGEAAHAAELASLRADVEQLRVSRQEAQSAQLGPG